MTPEDFLAAAKPLEVDEDARDNINDLKQHMESGRTIDPLALYEVDPSSVRASDGRHRAIAAQELGYEAVPVVDYTGGQQAQIDKLNPELAGGLGVSAEGIPTFDLHLIS